MANDFIDRPDADLPSVEFDDNLAAPFETNCLAKLCRKAEASRFRNPGKNRIHGVFSESANYGQYGHNGSTGKPLLSPKTRLYRHDLSRKRYVGRERSPLRDDQKLLAGGAAVSERA
jgi:hypothetical protein